MQFQEQNHDHGTRISKAAIGSGVFVPTLVDVRVEGLSRCSDARADERKIALHYPAILLRPNFKFLVRLASHRLCRSGSSPSNSPRVGIVGMELRTARKPNKLQYLAKSGDGLGV